MVVLTRAIVHLAAGLPLLLVSHAVRAEDAPVERPSVAQPALPQGTPAQPAVVTAPATAHPAPAARAERPSTDAPRSTAYAGRDPRHRGFLYLAVGPGLLTGLSGGKDFERTNPTLTGAVGVGLPISDLTELGFELNADLEIAGSEDRGSYAAALLRVRLARALAPNTRLWGALGFGRAGYQIGSLAGSGSVGAAYMFVPKFGLDVSANLNLVAAASDDSFKSVGVSYGYEGGFVLLLAVRALFEFHH